MAKFYGVIGFVKTIETKPGVWSSDITEKYYIGDIVRNVSRQEETDHLNDNITISNRISIVADPFAYNNFFSMGYINWMGTSWKITSVEVQRPRLILSIGGVYNGPTNQTT